MSTRRNAALGFLGSGFSIFNGMIENGLSEHARLQFVMVIIKSNLLVFADESHRAMTTEHFPHL